MYKRLYPLFSLILLSSCFAFFACSEIFEADISHSKIRLFSPSNKVTTITQVQQFRWQTLPEATSYAVDIVSPSFDSIATVISNRVVTTDTLTISLAPGRYQWAVTPINSISSGRSDTFTLIVVADSTRDLRLQSILVKSPLNGWVTNSQDIVFNWSTLVAAKEYRIQVAKPDFTNLSNIKSDTRLALNTLSLHLDEGIYHWRVRAENDQTNTDYTEQILTIDLTPPEKPRLLGPPTDSLTTVPVELRWQSKAIDRERDTLYVYQDSINFQETLILPLTAQHYNFSDTTSNFYFWRVRSVDKAGNASEFSPFWYFRTKK